MEENFSKKSSQHLIRANNHFFFDAQIDAAEPDIQCQAEK
jgi:hypothetical protein